MLLALNLESPKSEHDNRSSHSAREAALAGTCILRLYVPGGSITRLEYTRGTVRSYRYSKEAIW